MSEEEQPQEEGFVAEVPSEEGAEDQTETQLDLETRFAEVRRLAAEASESEVHLSITLNGINPEEKYRYIPDSEEGETLAEQLTIIERLLSDDRFLGFAEAGKRMLDAEGIARLANHNVKVRQSEYREATDAFHQISDQKPSEFDGLQRALGVLVEAARTESLSERLAALLKEKEEHTDAGTTE